jgi:hypothetical protein
MTEIKILEKEQDGDMFFISMLKIKCMIFTFASQILEILLQTSLSLV